MIDFLLAFFLNRTRKGAVRVSSSLLYDSGTTRIVAQTWRNPNGSIVRIVRKFNLPT